MKAVAGAAKDQSGDDAGAPLPGAPTAMPPLGRPGWLLVAALVVGTVLAYANAFAGVLLFDDIGSIVNNPSLHDLRAALSPPTGETVGGRPVLNLSLALNYALHGADPWGYHAGNLLIHLATGLLLFGLLRRTLRLLPPGPIATSARVQADVIAALVAGLFLLHPLQTESVTYVVQRAESLVSCWYLATLYTFVRGATTSGRSARGWFALSVLTCLLGMGSKEVMVSAPLIVLLLDRTLLAGSFAEVWRRRAGYYLALAATWLCLAMLVMSTSGRGETVGFATAMSPWHYLLTQALAIPHYLRLMLWPDPLVLDYGIAVETDWRRAALPGLLLALLLVLAVRGTWRRSAAWLVVLACFLVLAPSSSVVPIASQTMAEHRIYLVLAGVMALVVTPLVARWGRPAVVACLVWALLLGGRTVRRNADYHDDVTMWEQTVTDRPTNPRAHLGLAKVLQARGDHDLARPHLEEALRVAPTDAQAHNEMGRDLGRRREFAAAAEHFAAAVQLRPGLYEAWYNHGAVLVGMGKVDEGVARFRELITRKPDFPGVHAALGRVLAGAGRYTEATEALRIAMAQAPDSIQLEAALGSVLLMADQPEEALQYLERAAHQVPSEMSFTTELAKALVRLGRLDQARALYQWVLEQVPGHPEASAGLAAMPADTVRRPP